MDGITGTSMPARIFSTPRRKGSALPVRLSEPSAKMQTTWPAFSSSRALMRAALITLGLSPMGMACMRLRTQCRPGIS